VSGVVEREEQVMVVLGLLVMLACAALAVDAVVQNAASIGAIAFNQHITGLSLGAIFIAGTVVGLLFALGLAMFAGGLGRATRVRRERRALRRDQQHAEDLRAENERLARELAERRAASSPYPAEGGATTADAGTTTGRHRISR
jgi:hypothetical protein